MYKSAVVTFLEDLANTYPECTEEVACVIQQLLKSNSSICVDVNNVYVGRRATDGGLVLGYTYNALFPAIMSADMRSVFVVCEVEQPNTQNITELFLEGKLVTGTSFEQFKN